jgi:hypothetical protein
MDEIKLSEAQEKLLLDTWNKNPNNPPSIKDLTVAIFGEGYDGRSLQARSIKMALAEHNLKATTTADYRSKSLDIELSESHKTYIQNNVSTMNSLEIAKIIFANPVLTNLHAECLAVNNYIKTLNPRVKYCHGTGADVPQTKEYEPPKTFDSILKKVNTYINYVPDREKITPTQRKNLDKLMEYLHTYRLVSQMNNYQTEKERRLCEDAFIRATYDKPDLAQEEIDQYIEYSNQVVQGFNIQRRSNALQENLEEISGHDPDTMKISMSLVEAIGKASTEYHQCKQREQKLLDDLKEKRSARMSKQVKDNASILNLIQAWKSEETRIEMLKHAEKEQAAIADEVEHLSSLSELKARILGLSKQDILYG